MILDLKILLNISNRFRTMPKNTDFVPKNAPVTPFWT